MNRVIPRDGLVLTEDTTLEPGAYFLPSGMRIQGNDITVQCEGCVLIGANRAGVGLRIEPSSNVAVNGLALQSYRHGVAAEDCSRLSLSRLSITDTEEVEPNTVFLDIWRNEANPYGAGVLLTRVDDSEVTDCDLMHQQNGLLTYHCTNLKVERNNASYCSGYGFHLYDTRDSVFVENWADYCCRFEPREGGPHHGHMGADAAGFLAVMNSSRNVFRGNRARLGGDGFFLAGLAPDGTKCGCNDNLFEGNDASLSPNIAFEATFCSGNIYRNNFADHCNYGFWLGFSKENRIENNRIIHNRQAGVGVENGCNMVVTGNQFQSNGHGVLLWSKYVPEFAEAFPDNITSHHWQIERNSFLGNGKAIRIAVDQDHGIRWMPDDARGRPELRPHHHTVTGNNIQENRIGVELCGCDETVITGNTMHHNVEANLREEDCSNTQFQVNLGAFGAYL